MKRGGLYGGWHGGVKRLAAEQLVVQCGSMEEALRYVHQRLANSETIVIQNPLTGKNLADNFHQDIWYRLGWYLDFNFKSDGGLPDNNYGYRDWIYQHQWYYFFSYGVPCSPSVCSHSPRDIFNTFNTFLQRTAAARGEKLHNPIIFVLPYKEGTAVYISSNDLDYPLKEVDLFLQGLSRRVNSFVKSHSTE